MDEDSERHPEPINETDNPLSPARLAQAERARHFQALDTSGKHAFLIGEGHGLSATERLGIIHGKFPLPPVPWKSTVPTSSPILSSSSEPSPEQGGNRSVLTPLGSRRVRSAIHRSSHTGLPSIMKSGSWSMGTEPVVIPSGREDIPDAITRIEDAPSRMRDSSRKNA